MDKDLEITGDAEEQDSTDVEMEDGTGGDSLFDDLVGFAEENPEQEDGEDDEGDEEPKAEPADEKEREEKAPEQPEQPEEKAGEEGQKEEEKKPEEKTPLLAEETLRTIGARIGRHLASEEDLVSFVEQAQDRLDGYSELEGVFRQHEPARRLIMALAGDEPVTLEQAIQEMIDDGTLDLALDAPDPDLEPEKYKEYWRKKGEQEALRRTQKEQAEREKKARERMSMQAERAFLATAERYGLDDAGKKEFARELASIIRGDVENGRVRPDFADVIYRGLHHDRLLQEAVKAAETRARNAAIEEMKALQKGKKKGDGLPLLTGGGNAKAEAKPNRVEAIIAAGTDRDAIHEQF